MRLSPGWRGRAELVDRSHCASKCGITSQRRTTIGDGTSVPTGSTTHRLKIQKDSDIATERNDDMAVALGTSMLARDRWPRFVSFVGEERGSTAMAICDTCGNEYDKAFTVTRAVGQP